MSTSQREKNLPDVVMPACSIEKILKGQKALVTGASSGIGKGVAIALGQVGADVVVNYVSGEAAALEVVDEIRRCGVSGLRTPGGSFPGRSGSGHVSAHVPEVWYDRHSDQ